MEAARDGHTLLVKELLEKGAEEVGEPEGTGVVGEGRLRRGQVRRRVLDFRSCRMGIKQKQCWAPPDVTHSRLAMSANSWIECSELEH